MSEFRSIGEPLDVSNDDLDKAIEEMGVPSVVTPKKKMSQKKKTEAIANSVIDDPDVAFQVKIPKSVRKQIRNRAVDEDTSARHLILLGLQSIGFDVSEDALRDRRRS
ncbi:MAG: hypothetical protein AAF228_06105 [Pseudomonadota bacterium]